MSQRMEEEIARLSAEIYELAGKTFNINSPQQLGKVLFEDLNLPAPVKTGKGKVISTAADVLENARRGVSHRAQGAGVPPDRQAQGHLRGRAAGADRSAHRPRAHHLQPDRRGHRAAVVLRSQPAKHSDSHRSWAARSARLSCRARDGSWWSRIIRRSSCGCWRTCRAIPC